MKPIYVDDEIYLFFSSMKKDYGSFNNVVKAILRKFGEVQVEVEDLRDKIDMGDDYLKQVLLESVRHPMTVTSSSYSEGNKTMNVLPPTTAPNGKIPSKKGLARDLQLVFNAMNNKENKITPSKFLEKQNEVLKPQLNPPPPTKEKTEVIEMESEKPSQDES